MNSQFSCREVNGGASIDSTFLFQLFNICASRVEQHRLFDAYLRGPSYVQILVTA
jgi:hypothetical protein